MNILTNPQGKVSAISRVVALGAILSFAAAVPAYASTTNDAWLTTKVKTSLLTTDGVSSNVINVDTVNQQVTLHGTVNTAAEKNSAESAAKSVQGVKSVRNLLQVVPEKQEARVEQADNEISKNVTAALDRENSLQDSSIAVQSVNKGVVLLGGDAKNMTDQLTAVRVARRVPGVRRVASEVKGNDTLADADMWREDRAASASDTDRHEGVVDKTRDATRDAGHAVADTAKDAGHAVKGAAGATLDTVTGATRATTGAASDLYVTSMVKTRLLADKDTPAMDINVDTDDGVVTLFGEVPSKESKMAAEADAKNVRGVKSVRNELQVVATANKPAVTAKDDEIKTDVNRNLDSRDELKDVTADVQNCVVRLTGTVSSGVERVEAMQVARATRGVCSVKEELRFSTH